MYLISTLLYSLMDFQFLLYQPIYPMCSTMVHLTILLRSCSVHLEFVYKYPNLEMPFPALLIQSPVNELELTKWDHLSETKIMHTYFFIASCLPKKKQFKLNDFTISFWVCLQITQNYFLVNIAPKKRLLKNHQLIRQL